MRNIYIVNATQVVTSESHPEGMYSVLSGYPRYFDTINYEGDEDKTIRMAKSVFHAQQSAFEAADNRAMWTVTLEMANGKQITRESFGGFPIVPEPEPEIPEENENE